MRNYLSKILALSLPVILAFSIQECSYRNAPTEPETTTQTQPSEIIIYDPSDPRNPSNQTQTSTEPTDTIDPSGNPATSSPAPGDNTLPTDKAGIISMFNSALDKSSSLKRVSYTRKLTKCKIGFPIGDKTNDAKVQALSAMNDTAPAANNLVKLNDGMVSSATPKQEGSNFVFEITLNNATAGQDVKNGEGGFVGLIDYAETKTLVTNIAKEALGLDVSLKENPKYEFSAGKYTVTINSQTGAITKVKHSFTEGGSGKVSVTSVELSIDITAEYSA
ncbi:MAG: hypothetical protein LBS36_04135 [Oscillospiraceae bacterium]|jgi:hypothetical protein|nr:hypothetical protein [Oscillospiraceae bacterium]